MTASTEGLPAAPKPFGIFISYRRDDAPGYAGRLHELLESHFRAADVFMDQHSLATGGEWPAEIPEAIKSADVLLALIGPRWLLADETGRRRIDRRGDWVRKELALALRLGVRVIPVLLQGATVPVASSLPRSLRAMASKQAFELTESRWTYDTDRLVEILRVQEQTHYGGEGAELPQGSRLPAHMTTFVGRRSEVMELRQRLSASRLVTLTGPGGIGKTRLATEAARQLASGFAGGVHFVPLAAIADPELVATAIATVLGVREEPDTPLVAALAEHIADQQLLLILDNFEHVSAAAPVVAELRAACAGLRIVVTSRSPMHVTGEHEFPVPPLALPTMSTGLHEAALLANDAVALFLDRARLVRRGAYNGDELATIAGICACLDGLPLAIELAAARAKLLSPRVMLARLVAHLPTLGSGARDAPERHRTLDATIEWSYDLLEDTEKSALRQLSVFSDGASLDAAEAVLRVTGDAVLDYLESLVNHSLVVATEVDDGPRFGMLQTILEFVRVRLVGEEGAGAHDRHVNYFVTLAEDAEPKLYGPQQDDSLARLQREHENLRAALAWSMANGTDSGTAVIGQRLTAMLVRFWSIRGYLREGTAWLARALELSQDADPVTYVRLLNGASMIASARGDDVFAERSATAALKMAREIGDEASIAKSLVNSGTSALGHGDMAEAAGLLDEALSLLRRSSNRPLLAGALNNRGVLAHEVDDLDRAIAMHEEALAVRREIGDTHGIASSLYNVGAVAIDAEDFNRGYSASAEALNLSHQIGDTEGVAYALEALAWVAGLRGDSDRAARLLAVAGRVRSDIGAPVPGYAQPTHDRYLALAKEKTTEEHWDVASQQGAGMELATAIAYATETTRTDRP